MRQGEVTRTHRRQAPCLPAPPLAALQSARGDPSKGSRRNKHLGRTVLSSSSVCLCVPLAILNQEPEDEGSWRPGPVVLNVCSLGQWCWPHLRTCWKCSFSGYTPHLLNQKFWEWGPALCVSKALQATLMRA